MKGGVILQTRDFEILRTLYECTVASFEQLKRRHFSETNIQTASNRLGRLSKGGFVKSYRLGLVIYQGRPRQVNRIYPITASGVQTLSLKFPSDVHRADPVPIASHSLMHDLLLNDVHAELLKENPSRKFVNAKNLKILPSRMDQIPDLVMERENGELCEAIELELSVKSSKRYREIITNYRLSSRWKRILFITANDAIESKLRSIISGSNSHPGLNHGPLGKFHFRKISELIPSEDQSPTLPDQNPCPIQATPCPDATPVPGLKTA